jgi:SAM-dependent methyltransferase
MEESVRKLDDDALALFARKGREDSGPVPQAGEANGVKVRRIMQITRDLARRPFQELRILDVGCGEGVYAVEAGLRGADVLALDARTQRMDMGAACAKRHGLDNVKFVQQDVREVTRDTYGEFDVVYCLGLLYHLDVPDLFRVLENLHSVCAGMLVADTLVSLEGGSEATHGGRVYQGERRREHGDEDSVELRRTRVLKSIDNTFSFLLTRESLVRLLSDVGFSSVLECHAPPEPLKAGDRITLVALKGERVVISTYPWVNGKSELEIEQRLRTLEAEPL